MLLALRSPHHSLSGTQAFRLPARPSTPILDVQGSLAPLRCLPITLTALPLPPHQKQTNKQNPVIATFSLLNSNKLVLFHTPKDSSPGNVRGEKSCREKAITPGCGQDLLELSSWGHTW